MSKKTTAVVTGEAPGAAKVTKAKELGVPVLTEHQFETLLETGALLNVRWYRGAHGAQNPRRF